MAEAGKAGGAHPPDHGKRELILRELDRNLMVEAAAGTGKTTSMVGRMLALLESGKCGHIRHLAAVTFTRKAAAELRSRFQVELEKRARKAGGEEVERLREALDHVEQCFIGTIHSFCARLLRERPVEAGVDLAFEEIDEVVDERLLDEAWDTFAARLLAHDPQGLIEELDRLGLRLAELRGAFKDFSRYPDVEEWPLPQMAGEPDIAWAREKLISYVRRLEKLVPLLPREAERDKLIPLIRRLPRVISHMDGLDRPERLAEVLENFDTHPNLVQKVWTKTGHFSAEDAKAELAAWDGFRDEVALPALRAWREFRYPTVLRVLGEAREVYDELRRERGVLNFQDLLMKAAALLRDNPDVRRYFQSRFTHLLVDEFQDTDPIQAEVILLLASSDPRQRDWRACVPRPGSLFLVGDPKQSIYRFRRADITTYGEVKRILTSASGGLLVDLQANFRAAPSVISWVNRVFEPGEPARGDNGKAVLRFPGEETPESPCYVPLLAGREEGPPGELCGVYRITVPENCTNKQAVMEHEPDFVARFIRHAMDTGMTVTRSRRQWEEGMTPEVRPDDFMIVTFNKGNLGAYAQALQRYGIPHRVTGGQALNDLEELRLLYLCLRAVARPDDPVALVACLRSELFGVSDADLYAYRKAGGTFSFRAALPPGLDARLKGIFGDTFARLQRYSRWLGRLPHASACELMAGDLGLFALAAAAPGGDVQAGSLGKAIELLRSGQAEAWSTAQTVEFLEKLVQREEAYDGISALSGTHPAVRIMNLHKVKGLEAPVVFLADPGGESEHEPEIHIERSGGRILGYLAVHRETPDSRNKKLLAHPAGWESLAEKELGFVRAERLRLRYVAATRSGAATIITQRAKGNHNNPWRHFEPFIRPENELPDPGPQEPPRIKRAKLTPRDIASGAEGISSRLGSVTACTYQARAAKEYALSLSAPGGMSNVSLSSTREDEAVPAPPTGEHGVEWGEVVHLLLQAATADPKADLERLAGAALAEAEMDASLAPEAAALVSSVMGSEIWRRAQAAGKRLVEVPFEVLWDGEAATPFVLRGVIDLAFREEAGWVLVDYKTDRLHAGEIRKAAEKYASQVLLYARAWEMCSGEPVREAYLYFTAAGTAVKIDGAVSSISDLW